MGKKFKNTVTFDAPLKCEFQVVVHYDKKFKTNFISLCSAEIRPDQNDGRVICEETTVCVNNKKEAKEFLKVIKKSAGEGKMSGGTYLTEDGVCVSRANVIDLKN